MLSPGFRLGKYHIERPLGRGGMGAVFLATDTVLRRPVAIKVLAADKSDSSPARLLREARSASALNHPNIVAVYEIDEQNELPFISMEFVEGQTLSEIVEGGALTVEQSIRYGSEAADALAHAHDRGIVHSDLKAGNAIVSSSGRVKLVDFGIANRVRMVDSDATATSTATEQRALAGTPYSMAPEQVRGGEIDPRTDVWALGVLLYEMLSGAKPFAAPTVPELFSAILRDSPPPLPGHVPNGLQVIVQKCLAKHPADRYARAADVRLALESASGGEPLGSPGAPPAVMTGAPLPPPPFLDALPDATAFVGREAEIAQMTRVWDQARVGRRHLLLLAGEPGIGKTRLATEFARHCAKQVATVLAGRSDEEALIPYQPFAEALTWYARVCPEPQLRATLNAIGGGGELAPIIVELMRRIPDLRTSPKSEGEGERYRLFDVIDALLAAASSVHPIVLVLDDLHWADRPTLLLLKHLMRSTRTAALCIVGTYRDSELRRTHPLAEILADLRRDESVTRLSLDGLTGADVLELAPSIAGHSVSSRLAALVMESAGGNPFFIGELLRHLRETDSLRSPLEDIDFGLPEGVKEVIGRRLSRLSEGCNRALALAAVIGREFDVELLIALGDLSEDHLLDALDEAVRAQLIADAVSSRGRLAFRHALIRETLYGELLSVRRIRLHRRVAEAIEERAGGRADPPLADLAYHFSQSASAGTADKAVVYAMRAGDRASELLAYEEAARMYELALQSIEFASGPNLDARRVDLHIRRARAFGSLGQWNAEKDDALRALELLDPEDLERRAELVLMVADASFYLLDSSSVDRYASEALDLARQVNRDDLAADAMGWLGRSLQARGDLAGAIEMDNRANSLGKPRRGVALMHGPLTLYLAGHSHEATKQGRRAAETARTARDTELTMYALSHYGLSLGAIGQYRDAARTFEEARAFGRKYGVLPPLARATSMSGGFHVSVFDLDGAESIHTEARELARSLSFMPTIVSSGIDLLFVHVRRNDPGRAQVLLPEVETAAAATPGWHDWLWQGRLKQVRAELALACGDANLALDRAQDTVEFCRAKGRVKYQALAHITAARALRALSRTQEAIAHARDALAIARPISDPALLLWALNVLLMLDGDDGSAREARTLIDAIRIELPDEPMQRRFAKSDLVQFVPRVS